MEEENRAVMPREIVIWGRKAGTYGLMNGKSHLTAGFVLPLLLAVITSSLSKENSFCLKRLMLVRCPGASPLGKKGRNLLAISTPAWRAWVLLESRSRIGHRKGLAPLHL